MGAMSRNIGWLTILIALVVLAFGCKEADKSPAAAPQQSDRPSAQQAPPTPQPPAPEPSSSPSPVAGDPEAGGVDYQMYCATCHGPKGGGDGLLAATLNPKPARHSDGAYMNPLTDEYLFKVIKSGGSSVGKSPMMAPMGGMLSDPQIRNVVAFLRSLAVPPYEP